MRVYSTGLVVAGFMFSVVAHATTVSVAPTACSDFTTANGTATFPGTNVGTVGTGAGQTCQIGNIATNNVAGSPTTGTYVNSGYPTSIYSFYWGGGALTIQEELGNNGSGDAVNVSLDSLATSTSTVPSSTIATLAIPFQTGPTSEYTLISNRSLAAGYYAIDTQLATNAEDPTYQVNFSATATPEPASIALVLGSLAGLTFLRRRQNAA